MDGVVGVAALWGFAEATLFFIVPDVWLTLVAVVDAHRLLDATTATLAGAVLGGIVMRGWARRNPMAVRHAIALVPGISEALVASVDRDVHSRGVSAMLSGPLRGVPYKIYAAAAARARHGISTFVVVSLAARAPRLILLGTITCALCRTALAPLSWPVRASIVGTIWIVFYAWYFRAMSARTCR